MRQTVAYRGSSIIECVPPPHLANATTTYLGSASPGTQVSYVCQPPLVFPDNADIFTITCQENRLWRPTDIPSCAGHTLRLCSYPSQNTELTLATHSYPDSLVVEVTVPEPVPSTLLLDIPAQDDHTHCSYPQQLSNHNNYNNHNNNYNKNNHNYNPLNNKYNNHNNNYNKNNNPNNNYNKNNHNYKPHNNSNYNNKNNHNNNYNNNDNSNSLLSWPLMFWVGTYDTLARTGRGNTDTHTITVTDTHIKSREDYEVRIRGVGKHVAISLLQDDYVKVELTNIDDNSTTTTTPTTTTTNSTTT
ncbi:hypothetical protein Pmani_002022 [Petrolisthes manimaculis]|uniref:Sushi domain-containing protein n=1 Tax=Petrolisthes manimaculis TaxID=1843537 RepID=A0AAE1UJR7_9EUCA|nr:hypothetical protein Pmani_002022 [Petrolisthes manimaculis]